MMMAEVTRGCAGVITAQVTVAMLTMVVDREAIKRCLTLAGLLTGTRRYKTSQNQVIVREKGVIGSLLKSTCLCSWNKKMFEILGIENIFVG